MNTENVTRPWWAEDLKNTVEHFGRWLNAYFLAILTVVPLIRESMPNDLSPQTAHIVSITFGALAIMKVIHDNMRPQSTRHDDPPVKTP